MKRVIVKHTVCFLSFCSVGFVAATTATHVKCCFCTLAQCEHICMTLPAQLEKELPLSGPRGLSVPVRTLKTCSPLAHPWLLELRHTERERREGQLIRYSHRLSLLNLLQSSWSGRERTRNP